MILRVPESFYHGAYYTWLYRQVVTVYQTEIHFQQEKDCVLSHLAQEFGRPLEVDTRELHGHQVTFIIEAGEFAEDYRTVLQDTEGVTHVERLNRKRLLATKHSCGGYEKIHQNSGILRRCSRVSSVDRIYNVLVFRQADLRAIIEDLGELGNVTLGRLTEVGDATSELTPRQQEVIEAALEAGYFQWPRAITSDEMAERLGINRATYLEHLRKAQHKLLSRALADSS